MNKPLLQVTIDMKSKENFSSRLEYEKYLKKLRDVMLNKFSSKYDILFTTSDVALASDMLDVRCIEITRDTDIDQVIAALDCEVHIPDNIEKSTISYRDINVKSISHKIEDNYSTVIFNAGISSDGNSASALTITIEDKCNPSKTKIFQLATTDNDVRNDIIESLQFVIDVLKGKIKRDDINRRD